MNKLPVKPAAPAKPAPPKKPPEQALYAPAFQAKPPRQTR